MSLPEHRNELRDLQERRWELKEPELFATWTDNDLEKLDVWAKSLQSNQPERPKDGGLDLGAEVELTHLRIGKSAAAQAKANTLDNLLIVFAKRFLTTVLSRMDANADVLKAINDDKSFAEDLKASYGVRSTWLCFPPRI